MTVPLQRPDEVCQLQLSISDHHHMESERHGDDEPREAERPRLIPATSGRRP